MPQSGLTDSRLEDAAACLARRDYRGAHALCVAVLTDDPHAARAFALLGILTAAHNNHGKAIELFDRALAIEVEASALAQKARSLIALARKDEAVACANQAAGLVPMDGLTLDTLGVVFSRAGRHEAAKPFYDAAVSADPDNGAYHYNRGAALQFLGAFDEAAVSYRRAAQLSPDDRRALPAAVMLEKGPAATSDMMQLAHMFEAARAAGEADATLHLGHALAKAAEAEKDAVRAMMWLDRAKALKRQSLAYDAANAAALFGAALDNVKMLAIDPVPVGEGPIFIVGMPRTGTTLVDRILSSHPRLTSAGELSDFGVHLKRAAGTPSAFVLDPPTLRAASAVGLSAIGGAYEASVRSALAIDGRNTDKMPFNFFYAAPILAAMPSARIICLRRHPADTVLSNYRQLFATAFAYYDYAYDLQWAADYVAKFFEYVSALERLLPPARFTVVDYEKLVVDFEPEVRRLLDFAGLSFDPACLDFHANAAPVATASAAQVREPLYTSALGRWRTYRPALDPALEVLIARGVMSPDDLLVGPEGLEPPT